MEYRSETKRCSVLLGINSPQLESEGIIITMAYPLPAGVSLLFPIKDNFGQTQSLVQTNLSLCNKILTQN